MHCDYGKTVFYRFSLKNVEFEAKMDEWVGQNLNVHITLTV